MSYSNKKGEQISMTGNRESYPGQSVPAKDLERQLESALNVPSQQPDQPQHIWAQGKLDTQSKLQLQLKFNATKPVPVKKPLVSKIRINQVTGAAKITWACGADAVSGAEHGQTYQAHQLTDLIERHVDKGQCRCLNSTYEIETFRPPLVAYRDDPQARAFREEAAKLDRLKTPKKRAPKRPRQPVTVTNFS